MREKRTEANLRPKGIWVSFYVHIPFLHASISLDFLICNGGRKQVTEDAKELVQKEFSETHKWEQWEALAKEQKLI